MTAAWMSFFHVSVARWHEVRLDPSSLGQSSAPAATSSRVANGWWAFDTDLRHQTCYLHGVVINETTVVLSVLKLQAIPAIPVDPPDLQVAVQVQKLPHRHGIMLSVGARVTSRQGWKIPRKGKPSDIHQQLSVYQDKSKCNLRPYPALSEQLHQRVLRCSRPLEVFKIFQNDPTSLERVLNFPTLWCKQRSVQETFRKVILFEISSILWRLANHHTMGDKWCAKRRSCQGTGRALRHAFGDLGIGSTALPATFNNRKQKQTANSAQRWRKFVYGK